MRALIFFSFTLAAGFQVIRLPVFRTLSSNIFPGGCLRTMADSISLKEKFKLLSANCIKESSLNSVGDGHRVPPKILKDLIFAVTGNFAKDRDSVFALIKALGAADISPTVHKRVDFLLADDSAVSSETKHIRKAVKYGVKVVSLKYLEECKEQNMRVDPAPYLYHVTLSQRKEDPGD